MVVARALEKKGTISDRCELNRQIKADNALLMETVRQKMIIFRYQLLHIRAGKRQITDALHAVQPDIKQYEDIAKQLKAKSRSARFC